VTTTSEYLLGHTATEQERLLQQAAILRNWTSEFFRAAGLQARMRILDVGSGMGDVAMLAAEFGAQVTGIDSDAAVVQRARSRVAAHGLADQIDLIHADIFTFRPAGVFDAVIGRYILPHVIDPAGAVRHMAGLVRSGGLIVLHEVDFSEPIEPWPHAPLWDRTYRLLGESFRRMGKLPDAGRRLSRIFLDAGLPTPVLEARLPVCVGRGSYIYGWVAETVRSLLPVIEREGLGLAKDIGIDSLALRLESESVELGCQLMGPTQYGAWVIKP